MEATPDTLTAGSRAPAVTRAVQILKLLGRASEPMGVNAIARALGAVPSSCLHILRALADEGLVQADPRTKQYTLGVGLLTLAHDMLGRNHFARLVQPQLERIAREHGVTAVAVELDGRERMVAVAMAQAQTPMAIQVGVGSRFPAFISATGRCVAAYCGLSPAQLRQRFAALQWQSPPKFDDWLREVEACRRDGVAVDAGNYINGITVVAAPVEGPDGVRQAVSAVGLSQQLSGRTLASLKRDVRAAAQQASAQLRGLA